MGVIFDTIMVRLRSNEPGDSAYQDAVNAGFVGTKDEWLASLNGATFIPEFQDDVYPNEYLAFRNDKNLPNPDPVRVLGPRGITVIADPVTDLPVYDATYGYCRYLDLTYTRLAFVARVRNLVRVRLEVVSANPAITGTVVLVPVVNGVARDPVTINVGATPTEVTFPLVVSSGTLIITRTGGTLADSGGWITAIVTGAVLEVQYEG